MESQIMMFKQVDHLQEAEKLEIADDCEHVAKHAGCFPSSFISYQEG